MNIKEYQKIVSDQCEEYLKHTIGTPLVINKQKLIELEAERIAQEIIEEKYICKDCIYYKSEYENCNGQDKVCHEFVYDENYHDGTLRKN